MRSQSQYTPDVWYIPIASRKFVGYPMNPSVTPWKGLPHHNDLYVGTPFSFSFFYHSL